MEDIGYETKILETKELELKCKTLSDKIAISDIKKILFDTAKISKVIVESRSDGMSKEEEFNLKISVLKDYISDFNEVSLKEQDKEFAECSVKQDK